MVDEDETMEVASVGGRKPRVMARRILSEILQPRAEEIFHLVWDEIRRAGYEKSLNSGITMTGGGSILDGMPEIAEGYQVVRLQLKRPSIFINCGRIVTQLLKSEARVQMAVGTIGA